MLFTGKYWMLNYVYVFEYCHNYTIIIRRWLTDIDIDNMEPKHCCYIGGEWHDSIGILIKERIPSDKYVLYKRYWTHLLYKEDDYEFQELGCFLKTFTCPWKTELAQKWNCKNLKNTILINHVIYR